MLQLNYELFHGIQLGVGTGYQQRNLFEVKQGFPDQDVLGETSVSELRVLGTAEIDIDFDADEIRLDRRHRFVFEGRHYRSHRFPRAFMSRLRYQRIVTFGWHDLWFKLNGTLLWGTILYPEEEPVGGRYVRGVFTDTYYAKKVANNTVEYRMSVIRDIYKVSLFHDFAVFEHEFPPQSGEKHWRWANSFGLGFHALIFDTLQGDLAYAFGFASDKTSDRGAVLNIRKAF